MMLYISLVWIFLCGGNILVGERIFLRGGNDSKNGVWTFHSRDDSLTKTKGRFTHYSLTASEASSAGLGYAVGVLMQD